MITEDLFNRIPKIDTSNSDFFKEQASLVLKNNISNWKNFVNREYDMELDENDPHNIIAGSSLLVQLSPYTLEVSMRRVDLPNKMVLNHILIEFFKKTKIYTNKDLVTQIKKACDYLNNQQLDKYTGIVEFLSFGKRIKYKSKDWVLHEAMSYLKVRPNCIQHYESINKNGTFVIMDDGIYSGTQICHDIITIFDNVKECKIYIMSMFCAKVGLDLIETLLKFDSKQENQNEIIYKKGAKSVHLWKGYILIPTVTEILLKMFIDNKIKYNFKVIDEIHYHLLNKAASNIMFEHKIPDYKSFPSILHNFFYIIMFDYFSQTPPYSPARDKKTFEINTDYNFKCSDNNSFGKNIELTYLKKIK